MLNWFRQWRINRLLIEVKRDEAIQKTLAKMCEADENMDGQIAANKERLRQLGWDDGARSLQDKIRSTEPAEFKFENNSFVNSKPGVGVIFAE